MKEFVIRVKRTWMLLILPILALLYFVVVVAVVATKYDTGSVTYEMLVWGGLGLFALVILVELPLFLRRKVRTQAAPPFEAEPAVAVAEAEPYAPTPAATIAVPVATAWDDEKLVTSEVQQGLTVLEYSSPAKSRHKNAVYTKAYVPVSKQHVLRVETLAAEGADL